MLKPWPTSLIINGLPGPGWSRFPLISLGQNLYFQSGRLKGVATFKPNCLDRRIVKRLRLPASCKLHLLSDKGRRAKALVWIFRDCGWHMIPRLKSNSVLCVYGGKKRLNPSCQLLFLLRKFFFAKKKQYTPPWQVYYGDQVPRKRRHSGLPHVLILCPLVDGIKSYVICRMAHQMIEDLKNASDSNVINLDISTSASEMPIHTL